MRLFTLESGDIPHTDYTSVCHVNLDCVAFIQEFRYKQNPTSHYPPPKDTWQVGLNGILLSVTEAAFERLKRAMEESQ